jgi:uncharacterized integral membrane protein
VSNARTLLVLLIVLAVGLGALFAVQNSSRTTQLSLDLGVAAWQLQEPVQVPALIGVCFGAGVLVGVVGMTVRVARLSARVRQLEQQAAINGVKDSSEAARW